MFEYSRANRVQCRQHNDQSLYKVSADEKFFLKHSFTGNQQECRVVYTRGNSLVGPTEVGMEFRWPAPISGRLHFPTSVEPRRITFPRLKICALIRLTDLPGGIFSWLSTLSGVARASEENYSFWDASCCFDPRQAQKLQIERRFSLSVPTVDYSFFRQQDLRWPESFLV